jgi:predicted Ser/Thr protein kinase
MQPGREQGGDAIQFEPFTPPSMAELDALIPAYQFVEFIDRGGMGAVYKAVQKSLNRIVAVKLLPQVNRNKESFAERFKREAHALAQLNHPHIIAVHDFGETADGQMYYAMEFVSGMDLQHLLKRQPPEPRQILRIITQVCEALQYAHERGIVHRDIKPANILIDERGNVKVADFGLAKVVGPQTTNYTATGTTLGTPDYIAPEALDQAGKIDHRADIYSLGVMIYELFTGHVPKGVWEPPSLLSGADKSIDAVVSKAMQNNPDKRYQHVSDMTQVLEKLLKSSENWKNFRRPPKSDFIQVPGDAGRIPTDADTIRLQPRRSRKRRTSWVAGAVLLLGGAAVAAWQAGWLGTAALHPGNGSAARPPAQAVEAERPAEAQARLAHWVFEHDGFLNVLTPANESRDMGGAADIWDADHLPAGPYTIWRVCFAVSGQPISNEKDLEELISLVGAVGTVANLNLRGLRDVPVASLAGLSKLHTLSNLDLTASPLVTHDAVAHLAACRQLKLLRVGGSDMQVEHAVIAELQALLPDCLIRND